MGEGLGWGDAPAAQASGGRRPPKPVVETDLLRCRAKGESPAGEPTFELQESHGSKIGD